MKTEITTSRIIAGALVVGVLLFSAVTSLLTNFTHIPSEIDLLGKIALALTIIGSFASRFMGKFLLNKINKAAPLTAQFAAYKNSLIIRLALLEGPAMFTIVLVMLTSNYEYYITTLLLVAQMIGLFPHKQRLISDMKLSKEEEAFIFH